MKSTDFMKKARNAAYEAKITDPSMVTLFIYEYLSKECERLFLESQKEQRMRLPRTREEWKEVCTEINGEGHGFRALNWMADSLEMMSGLVDKNDL